MSLVAIVRPPDASLARCELTHVARRPIDVERALAQHAAYVAALESLGCTILALPPLADQPDAAFVEDAAVVLDDVAIVPNMGAPSRRAESASVAAALAQHRPIERMSEGTTLDGGDVLRMGDTLYVGWSSRTNHAGLRELAHRVLPHGLAVKAVEVRGCLHLKTACTRLDDDTLLARPRWVSLERVRGVRVLAAPDEEPFGANVVALDGGVIVPAEHPRTAELLAGAGHRVVPIELDELAKAEAGPTCLSLLFSPRARAAG